MRSSMFEITVLCTFLGFSNKGYKGPSCSTSASSSKELCKFNMTELGDCGSRDKLHGYGGENHTCVFVKINKVSFDNSLKIVQGLVMLENNFSLVNDVGDNFSIAKIMVSAL